MTCSRSETVRIAKYSRPLGLNGATNIIYIPDLALNLIPVTEPANGPEDVEEIVGCCYTGNDFVEECGGDVEKARHLFWYCDWQHPSSALPEIEDDEEE